MSEKVTVLVQNNRERESDRERERQTHTERYFSWMRSGRFIGFYFGIIKYIISII